jgi:apolipoprotein N-acyltransferase
MKKLFLSLLTGLFLSLAFPPLKLGFLAYWGLIPFFYLLRDLSYKEAMKWGYLTGLFLNIGTLYWISWVTLPGTIAAILYLPVYLVLYAALHTFIRKRIGEKYLLIWIPFLWTGIEFIRSIGVLGFPWTSLAYTQTYYLALIQYATYTSIYGVSFWVVLINVTIFAILRYYDRIRVVIALFIFLTILFILPWIYGKLSIPKDIQYQDKIRVAVVQGNVDSYLKSEESFWKENFEIYERLTLEAAQEKPQLIIWPETAIPCFLRYNALYLGKVRELASRINIPIITGAHDVEFYKDGGYQTHNGVFLIIPNSNSLQSYSKLHLVPFGERVPFTEIFPLLKETLEMLEMGEGNFSPGNALKTFRIPVQSSRESSKKSVLRMPVVVCFESMFPELVRKFVMHKNATMLAIITNDGWFRKTSAPYHHSQVAVFRAIENRIAIARAANTGVSMFIDAYGRTMRSTPIFERTWIAENLSSRREHTFFTRFGPVFAITISLFNLGPIIVALFKNDK